MSWYRLAQVVAILCLGVGAGVYIGDWAGARAFRLEAEAGDAVRYQQIVHVRYQLFMPGLVIGAVLASAVWLFALRRRRGSIRFAMVAGAFACSAVIAVLTLAVSVPLNNELMTWHHLAPPADFAARWAPWDRVNGARAVLATVALVLAALAAVLRDPGAGQSPPG